LIGLSAALISVLLVSAFSTGLIFPAKAPTPITLWMILNDDPGPGYYGGYHNIAAKLVTEFAKIGVTVERVYYDAGDWESIIWGDQWNRTGDYDGDGVHELGVDGWDLTIFEWWLNPSSYIWLDEMAYSWGTPPTGWNIMSWNDTTADLLYQKAQTVTGTPAQKAAKHMTYMKLWQDEFMHNPPVIPIYYGNQYTARASYLDNWDDVAWLYDLSQLDINETKFNEVAPASRKTVGSDKVIWAAAEDIWTLFPLGTLTYTEETVNVLKQGMLYRQSRENMISPTSGRYINLPTLAADNATWYQKPDGRWAATVPLVEGLTWTDGVPFNASDVAYTWELNLSPSMKSQSYGDFSFLIDEVNVVDEYTVDFVYKQGMGPDYDFEGYQAIGWALGMLPKHQLWDPAHPTKLPINWQSQTYSSDPIPVSAGGDGLECLGPYVPISYTGTPGAITSITFQKRANFVDTLGWSSTMPDYFIMKIIGTSATRFVALQNLEADFIEYPIAPIADWEAMMGWPTHEVFTYLYPASHPLWMQQRNPVLSNRYVRLALAHAIPYQSIFTEVLDDWGVATPIQGKTFVLPSHDVYASDVELPPYEYDIAKAQMYMDMYQNSIDPVTWEDGPLGDHDFNGLVEIPDYPLWVNNLGKSVGSLPWWPSTPIDPDNNNNGYVQLNDIWYWAPNIGKEYPFANPR
jgi:ABC-type transport system substrate-binding protein